MRRRRPCRANNVRASLAVLSLAAFGCAPDEGVWFVDEAAKRGVDFAYQSGWRDRPLLPEIVGGGVALADVDGDGDLDIYFTQAGRHLGGAEAGPGNALFLNRGDGFFDPAPGRGADTGYGMGVAAGDYDNDGDVDLYVTNLGANALLRNDGAARFEDVAAAAGVAGAGWSTAAVFFDADVDGDLDLFVVDYLAWSVASEQRCHARGAPTYCAPTAYDAPTSDRLYRNEGDGTFVDVTAAAGVAAGFGNGLGALAEDFNDDGLPDLFVANDRMFDQLWINQGDMRFRDEAFAWGCAVDDNGVAKAGMGVAAADLDDDGDAELLVVNLETESDSLYRNEGRHFVDVTAQAGLAVASRRHTRFGVAVADFDSDGWLDIYEANGKVDGNPGAQPDAFREPNALFRGGHAATGAFRFAEVPLAGGVRASPATSRALAVGDVDGDGSLDIVVVNRDAPARLLMNARPQGGAVRFRVVNQRGAPALGAKVSVRLGERRIVRRVRVASGYLASHDPAVHIGVGAAPRVSDVVVRWVDGAQEAFGDFAAGQVATLRRGKGRAMP